MSFSSGVIKADIARAISGYIFFFVIIRQYMRSEGVIQEKAQSSVKQGFSKWSSDNIVFLIDSWYSVF